MQPMDPHGEQLRRLQALTDSDLARLDVDELLEAVLERVRDLLHVDTGAVLLLEPSGAFLVARAALGLEEETRQGVRIPFGRGFAGRVAQERKAVTIAEVDHGNVLNPILREKGIRSLLGVPLCIGEDVIGVVHVGTLEPRIFTAEDAELLQLAADRIALATRARMTHAELTAASVLQRSLLPGLLPEIPGLELAARYVPGGGGDVGGDWYDVFDLPSGRLCVVVGDVVGRGLNASVAMSRLRSAMRAYALVSDDPSEMLRRLDEQTRHFEPDVMATVLCAVVEPTLDVARVSSAGHPPPIRAVPGHPGELVEMPADPPIGLTRSRRRHTTMVDLPAGGGLVLYTDGLVERRHESLDTGLQRLMSAVVPGPAELVCSTVMGRMIGNHQAVDDVALLVVMRSAAAVTGGSLTLVEPAEPRSLRVIRHAVRTYVEALGATPAETADLVLAVGEACANAVEHAYGPGGGTVEVQLERDGPRLTVTVTDTGSWRDPRGTNRGRGTTLMYALMDDIRVDRGLGGTQVVLTTTLGRREDTA
ncbi:protein serine/threonine phosphatase with GAF(s) sensor(s) [Pseudonocardia dioxanivorans CB1190]|uniref:Protein serine/threonine phosphatase with GAF(S) sensor(S) n=2 Tax=Pseudonocardia dioxanivorans TaxID=240495 RepID=F4CUC7_PSEUX|nr:protein serine/threonine phosphatase with GAF(s) sensor(s) [Pseudonocardia dioxanivorans CB1190]